MSDAEQVRIAFREHVASCCKCKPAKQLDEMCQTGVDLYLKVISVNRKHSEPAETGGEDE